MTLSVQGQTMLTEGKKFHFFYENIVAPLHQQ